jgi:SAM-dependent methyltransferase
MLEEAYHELHALEGSHWWYVGARAVYRTLLLIGFGKPKGGDRMLEVGSGSGGNLSLLSEYGPTAGVELSWIGLSLTPVRPALGLVQAKAEALPFMKDTFDGVHLLGVIEHLDDDIQALREAARVCRPNGAITMLTSALPILWSHHDEANMHKRRYIRRELNKKIFEAGCIPVRISYQNFFSFLPTLFVRLRQKIAHQSPLYDMGKPPPLLNSMLASGLRFEAWLIRYLDLPIGVDLVAVCRPKKST